MNLEDTMAFLDKDDPVILLKWLRNAAEVKSQSEKDKLWWRISQVFEEAAYKIVDVREKAENQSRIEDSRLLIFPSGPVNREEAKQRYRHLIRAIQGEIASAAHDDSGYSAGMARRGIKQLEVFVKHYPEAVPENHNEVMEDLHFRS